MWSLEILKLRSELIEIYKGIKVQIERETIKIYDGWYLPHAVGHMHIYTQPVEVDANLKKMGTERKGDTPGEEKVNWPLVKPETRRHWSVSQEEMLQFVQKSLLCSVQKRVQHLKERMLLPGSVLPLPLPAMPGKVTLSRQKPSFPLRRCTFGSRPALGIPKKIYWWRSSCCLLFTFVVQSVSSVWLFATPWAAAHQASLSFTSSQSLFRFMPIESVMLSNHLILCCPFSFCLHSFPASGSFPVSQLLASGGQSIRASASASILPTNIQGWLPSGLTGLILQSKGLSRVFSRIVYVLFAGPEKLLLLVMGNWK